MSPRARILAIVASVPLLLVGVVLLAGTVAYGAALVRVYVDEKKPDGDDVHLVVPTALIPLSLKLVPDRHLRTASAEFRPWLPVIAIASRELAHIPDGLLVEVKSPDEQVSIVKRGGSLVIDVESEDATVHVSVPLKLVASMATRLETIGPNL